jgi:23S rRNA pseudouridine2605 synthase
VKLIRKNSSCRGKNIRLQVFLSHAGIASRRAAEDIIAQGRVSVNGITVKTQGSKVNDGDTVLLDGKEVNLENQRLYLALNKPAGFLCTSNDPQGRPIALDLLPQRDVRLYSVGRLDFLSCGLIFFTNDGNFASNLGHPSCGIEKEYVVEATGMIPDSVVEAFNCGITIEGVYYKAKTAERTDRKSLRIVLIEGKNREIRRVFSHFHLHPALLRRVRIGQVHLGDLPEGTSRPLTNSEITALHSVERKRNVKEGNIW